MKIPVLIALVAFAVSTVDAGAAERFRPAASDYVVLRVPARAANDPIAILEQRYERAPDQVTASELAALYVERAREQREARYFGRAEMLLQPWLAKGDSAALRVQADILQNRHDFAGAIQLLDRAVERNPGDAGARLMRASVKVVQGHSAAARGDCAAVLASGASVAGTVCLAEVLGNTGQLAQAEAILKSVVLRDEAALPAARRTAPVSDASTIASPSVSAVSTVAASSAQAPSIRGWALWLLADFADRRGDAPAAESFLREALRATPSNEGIRSALCDALIARGALREALALVALPAPSTGLLARRAHIQHLMGDAGLGATRAQINDLLNLASRRGERPHLREEALIALDVDGDADHALQLAKANFETQRETVDARLLVRAARARGDREGVEIVARWMRETGFEDEMLAGIRT